MLMKDAGTMTDTAPKPRGRPGTSADTRARLVAAAKDVFLERGYANTRVQDITDAAGFTTGALYSHFDSRMEILAEALLTEGERLVDEVAGSLVDFTAQGGVATSRLAEQLTGGTRDVDRLMLEAITLATRSDEARTTIVSALTRVSDRLDILLKAALDGGRLDPSTDPQAASLLILSIILGGTVVRALDLPRADADRVTEIIVRARGNPD